MVLVELLLDTDADIVARAKTHAALFQRVCVIVVVVVVVVVVVFVAFVVVRVEILV